MHSRLDKKDLLISLVRLKVIRFGQFCLGNGLKTPVYVDLRRIISYPDVLSMAAALIAQKMEKIEVNVICGVPHAAVPLATAVALRTNSTLVMYRSSVKPYGTGRRIEGDFIPGSKCALVEDVIVAGTSVLDTAVQMRAAGLKITDAFIVMDRLQGGVQNLEQFGIKVHCLVTIDEVLKLMSDTKLIEDDKRQEVLNFLSSNQVALPHRLLAMKGLNMRIPMLERSEYTRNQSTKSLMVMMHRKQSNIFLDLTGYTKLDHLLKVLKAIGKHIALIRINPALLSDPIDNYQQLADLKISENFWIIERHIMYETLSSKASRISGYGMHRGFGISDIAYIDCPDFQTMVNMIAKTDQWDQAINHQPYILDFKRKGDVTKCTAAKPQPCLLAELDQPIALLGFIHVNPLDIDSRIDMLSILPLDSEPILETDYIDALANSGADLFYLYLENPSNALNNIDDFASKLGHFRSILWDCYARHVLNVQ